EWTNGTVYTVRSSRKEDERFAWEFKLSLWRQPAFEAYLDSFGLPSQSGRPDYEPDARFGPWVTTGALCPPGAQSYASWSTLILEVGLSRGWGHDKGLLDWKARHWARMPGVRFILCVAVTERFTSIECKLHTVERDPITNRARRLPDLNPVPVVEPHTMLSFDSRELLGLPAGADIPPIEGQQFPDPTIDVDLYKILERLRR
ncbi:hypothetical protein PHYSODRAFT_468699, partial [Phytophthora sojae]